jgi:diketogulonate reductase-like aldo/keto reductase
VLVHFPGETFIETTLTKKPSCFKKPDNWSKCRKETWQALEKVFKDGTARAIGVANYAVPHLQELIDMGGMLPAVNQMEFHPYWHLGA